MWKGGFTLSLKVLSCDWTRKTYPGLAEAPQERALSWDFEVLPVRLRPPNVKGPAFDRQVGNPIDAWVSDDQCRRWVFKTDELQPPQRRHEAKRDQGRHDVLLNMSQCPILTALYHRKFLQA